MDGLPYGERLKRLDLFSLKGRLIRADMILVWKILSGKSCLDPDKLFTLMEGSVTRGHPRRIYPERARLEPRHRFFTLRVINLWNSLSAGTVMAETLCNFKKLLKQDLGELLFEYVD